MEEAGHPRDKAWYERHVGPLPAVVTEAVAQFIGWLDRQPQQRSLIA